MKEGVNVSDKGWIVLDRKITEHWVWSDRPFSYGQAWLDLIMRANHKDKRIVMGSKIIDVERGSFISSETKLAEFWGWSRAKVIRFLKMLESDNMIIKKADNKKTAITIVNYGVFNDFQNQSEQQMNIKRTTAEHQMNSNRTPNEHKQQCNNVTMKQCNNKTINNNVSVDTKTTKTKKTKVEQCVEINTQLFNDLIGQYNLSETANNKVFDWIMYKAERKEPYTERGMMNLLKTIENKIKEFGEQEVIKAITLTIGNEYQGIGWYYCEKSKPRQQYAKQQVTFEDMMKMDIGE